MPDARKSFGIPVKTREKKWGLSVNAHLDKPAGETMKSPNHEEHAQRGSQMCGCNARNVKDPDRYSPFFMLPASRSHHFLSFTQSSALSPDFAASIAVSISASIAASGCRFASVVSTW